MLRWMVTYVAALVHLAAFLLFGAFFLFAPGLLRTPSAEQIRALVAHGQIRTFPTRDGSIGGRCHIPHFVSLEQIAAQVEKALIAIEDRRFASHLGIDPRGIARAFAANLAGRAAQGGSTLTQQLVKNLLFQETDSPLQRKLIEIPIALRFEMVLSKREILTAYLNHVYFAGGVVGIEAAARHFFGKPARDLNALEAAMLVGMLKSPRDYSPADRPEAALARAHLVLDRQVALGIMTPKEAAAAKARGLRPGTASLPAIDCEHFRDHALREAKLDPRRSERGRILVTLDAADQAALVGAASRIRPLALAREGREIAAVRLDGSGGIRAMIGGTDYAASRFNRASDARRSPGSTAKLALYAEACERGLTPKAALLDRAVTAEGWPANSDGEYWGRISLQDSFIWSRNGSAVRLEDRLGADRVAARAKRLGFEEAPEGRGVSLGGFGASPLAVTAAYASIVGDGRKVSPHAVLGVIGPMAQIRSWRETPSRQRVLSPDCVAAMRRLLRGVVAHGTGRAADLGPLARGKTGTSDGYRDAWFVGDVAGEPIGIWIGNDDGTPMRGVGGGGLPARLFRDYGASILKRDAARPARVAARAGAMLPR